MKEESTKEILRKVEHCALRDFYYHDSERFAEILITVPNAVFNIIDSRCKEKGLPNPFRREQFMQSIIELPDGNRALRVSFPEIKEMSFCRRIYAFLTEDNKKAGYYCIENGNDEYSEEPFVSEWIPYGKSYANIIYNSEGLTPENEFLKCAEFYRDVDPATILEKFEKDQKTSDGKVGKYHEII